MSEGDKTVGDLWREAEDAAMDAAIRDFQLNGVGEMTPDNLGVIKGSWGEHGDKKGIRLVELKLSGKRQSFTLPLVVAGMIVAISLDALTVIGCASSEGARRRPVMCKTVDDINGGVFEGGNQIIDWIKKRVLRMDEKLEDGKSKEPSEFSCDGGTGYCG